MQTLICAAMTQRRHDDIKKVKWVYGSLQVITGNSHYVAPYCCVSVLYNSRSHWTSLCGQVHSHPERKEKKTPLFQHFRLSRCVTLNSRSHISRALSTSLRSKLSSHQCWSKFHILKSNRQPKCNKGQINFKGSWCQLKHRNIDITVMNLLVCPCVKDNGNKSATFKSQSLSNASLCSLSVLLLVFCSSSGKTGFSATTWRSTTIYNYWRRW